MKNDISFIVVIIVVTVVPAFYYIATRDRLERFENRMTMLIAKQNQVLEQRDIQYTNIISSFVAVHK